MFPISLIPVLWLLYFVLPWAIVTFLIIVCLAPVPAPGRAYFEFRGYEMSLFTFNFLADQENMPVSLKLEKLNQKIEFYNYQFVSMNYYEMWPFGMKDRFQDSLKDILSGEIMKNNVIYRDVATALEVAR